MASPALSWSRRFAPSATPSAGRTVHIRLTTTQNGQHHVTLPNHSPVKPGTLGGILKAVALHHRLTVEELLRKLDL